MSITVELPPDLEQQVRDIPNVGERVAAFLRDQVEYENWRKQRYGNHARQIVQESLAEADRLKEQGISREEMFRRFFTVTDTIARQL